MINVLFEDESLLVIEKPPGLVVTPAETTINQKTLSEILETDFKINIERGGIVHRLDKDTSGVMLVAKTTQALENLQFQFKERMVKKEYLALVHGFMEEEKEVDGGIIRNPGDREKFIVSDEGREAHTKFEPVQKYLMSDEKLTEVFEGFNKIQFRKLVSSNYQQFSLVRCFPLTGRTHQIRVHLKYSGFPIVGDQKYGGRKTSRLDFRFCKRQFLHAAKISFYHPISGERMEFESQLWEDLRDVLDILK